MTLENLVGIGKLKRHEVAADEIGRLLDSARAALSDSKRKENASNSRMDLAYKAIMQAALAALMANGYRPSTSEPGHQQTTIQSLPKTIGLTPEKMRMLDGFRRARNIADYEGDPVEERTVAECVRAAETLIRVVESWLGAHRPDLFAGRAKR